jgi:ABC-type antimicrobial peptide transport system permease subunit
LLAVQNTYISAFQAIGALGLLLGTVGLAVVQVRSVLERRRELALLQAIGFSHFRIAQLLLIETLVLLVGGLCVGVAAALIAIVPYMLSGNSQANIVEPLVLLAIVLAVGLAASTIAIRTAMRQPILKNLQ